MYRIYLVEDDAKIASIVADHLGKYGYELHTACRFEDIKGEFLEIDPHLVLLDINLPYYDGFYWCRQLRTVSTVPVIFVTARAGEMDQVMALENGGDDYLVKPFNLDVATAKVKSALRRAYGEYSHPPGTNHPVGEAPVVLGDLRWDRGRLEVERLGRRVLLSRNEGLLLDALASAAGRAVTRAALLEALWDDTAFVDDNTLTVNVTRLRRKLAELGAPDAILTVRGYGYRLDLEIGGRGGG